MTTPYQAAINVLRRVQQGLARDISPAERTRLLTMHEQALGLLEQSQATRRLSTVVLAARVLELERELADRPPAERVAIIRERLGLSRSRYYELRGLRQSG